ncbi:OsmC family protein [Spirillospora sp. CA-253888]
MMKVANPRPEGHRRRAGGAFTEVVLRPEVVVTDPGLTGRAEGLHERAHEMCFIANSVNFPVRHEATVKTR